MTNNENMKKSSVRKRFLVVVYLVLIIGIGILLWKKFYVKRTGLELKYGETPGALLTLVDNTFPNQHYNKIALIFVFNHLPVLPDIENINKLYHKHRDKSEFFIIFHQQFKSPAEIKFPHEFVSNSLTECHYMGKDYDSNYFILLDDKKVRHVDRSMNSVDLNFLIEKHLYPEKNYESYAVSTEQLQDKIVKELKEGDVELLNVNENKYEKFRHFKEFAKIYVIINKCSSCELKALVSDLKLRQVLNSGKTLVIFPIFANESQLKDIIDKEKINLPIYLDYNDRFDLFSIITSPNDKFIVIENQDITELKPKEASI